MILLDTTVLVYATGGEHQLREPCRRIVALIADGSLHATTSVEVLQEYTDVRARRTGRSDAVQQALAYADLLGPLVGADEAILRAGFVVYSASTHLGAFDAVLVATAIAAGAAAVVSADRAFGEVTGLRHVVPDDAGVELLLGLA